MAMYPGGETKSQTIYHGAVPVSANPTVSGDTLLATPSSGRQLAVWFYQYSNRGSSLITVGLRYGLNGTIHFRAGLAANGGGYNANILAGAFRSGMDEALYVNLSANGDVLITVLVVEE